MPATDNTSSLPSLPIQRILAAAHFAARMHAGQRRKGNDPEPYINHLIEVAELVAGSSEVMDTNLIMAAFLHDTVEDTRVTAEELRESFGEDVTALVLEITDDKTLPKERRKQLQVENAPRISLRAQTLELADKISNLRAILHNPPTDWSAQRKQEYFDWAQRVVSGLKSPNEKLKQEFDRAYARKPELAEK